MTKKRLFALVMTLVMVALSFTACGGTNKADNKANKENATATENAAASSDATIKAEGTQETEGGYISIATGGTGGTYYPLGGSSF